MLRSAHVVLLQFGFPHGVLSDDFANVGVCLHVYIFKKKVESIRPNKFCLLPSLFNLFLLLCFWILLLFLGFVSPLGLAHGFKNC